MTLNGDFETQRVRLRSPALYIGGPYQSFGPGDIAVVPREGLAYLIDREALGRIAFERNGADGIEALGSMLRSTMPSNLDSALVTALGSEWRTASTADGRALVYRTIGVGRLTPNADLNRSRPFVRDANGDAYIPGSSIKGALRTGVLAAIFPRPASIGEDVRGALSRNPGQPTGNRPRKVTARLINLELPLRQGFGGGPARNAPSDDLFRAVRVGDSAPIADERLQLRAARVSVQATDGTIQLGPPLIGEFATEVEVTLDLSLDRSLLYSYHWPPNRPQFRTVAELLGLVRGFYGKVWDEDRAFWSGASGSFYHEAACAYHLRLGGGSGWLSTTLGMYLDRITRFRIIKQNSLTKRATLAGRYEPTSRTVLETELGPIPLGWCSLDIVDTP